MADTIMYVYGPSCHPAQQYRGVTKTCNVKQLIIKKPSHSTHKLMLFFYCCLLILIQISGFFYFLNACKWFIVLTKYPLWLVLENGLQELLVGGIKLIPSPLLHSTSREEFLHSFSQVSWKLKDLINTRIESITDFPY